MNIDEPKAGETYVCTEPDCGFKIVIVAPCECEMEGTECLTCYCGCDMEIVKP